MTHWFRPGDPYDDLDTIRFKPTEQHNYLATRDYVTLISQLKDQYFLIEQSLVLTGTAILESIIMEKSDLSDRAVVMPE